MKRNNAVVSRAHQDERTMAFTLYDDESFSASLEADSLGSLVTRFDAADIDEQQADSLEIDFDIDYLALTYDLAWR